MSTGLTTPVVHSKKSNTEPYTYRSGLGIVESAEFAVRHYDFLGPVTTNVPNGWSAAIIDVGATLTTSTTAVTAATGAVVIGSDGASEGVSIYLPKGPQLTAGKKFFMEVKVQTNLAAETDVQFGLSDLTATTNPEDLWTTTSANLVAFGTLAGSANLKMLSDKANSGTSVQTQTVYSLANATYATLAIAYDGANLRGYMNGQLVLTWSGASTTIPTGTALAPFIGGRTGATLTNTVTFDYVRLVWER